MTTLGPFESKQTAGDVAGGTVRGEFAGCHVALQHIFVRLCHDIRSMQVHAVGGGGDYLMVTRPSVVDGKGLSLTTRAPAHSRSRAVDPAVG